MEQRQHRERGTHGPPAGCCEIRSPGFFGGVHRAQGAREGSSGLSALAQGAEVQTQAGKGQQGAPNLHRSAGNQRLGEPPPGSASLCPGSGHPLAGLEATVAQQRLLLAKAASKPSLLVEDAGADWS